MEKQRKQSDRSPRFRFLRRGALLRRPDCGSLSVLSCLLPIISVLAVSCIRTEDIPQPEPEIEEMPADTVKTMLKIINGADWCSIAGIDVLIYDKDGQCESAVGMKADGNEVEIPFLSTAGQKECIIVANSSRNLKLKIMDRLDTMQSLTFAYEDEDPDKPVMVARAAVTAGKDTVLTLQPFLCRVVIEEVSNAMDGWVLMEEPEVYLSDINPEVGILQEKEFRPSATLEEGPAASLPYDIGFYSQYPGTVLHFYPNDTPERVLGGCRTTLTFRCKVEGEVIEETVALPPSGRNSLVRARVSMSADKKLAISF